MIWQLDLLILLLVGDRYFRRLQFSHVYALG